MTQKITGNIYLAASFMCAGAALIDVDKTEDRHQKFVFDEQLEGEADLGDVELEFANGTLMVNAVEYGDALRRIKSLIHTS